MRYEVIIEVFAEFRIDAPHHTTEWIVGGAFPREENAWLFAAAYEGANRKAGLEAIVVYREGGKE